MDLSAIDKRILYELGQDARQSYRAIAQKIKSKKEVVHYHLQRLEKEGVIWKYVPVFSLSRLGIFAFKLYIRLHGLTKETEKSMIDTLCKDARICWVAQSTGRWDLMIASYARNPLQFAELKNELFDLYGLFIEDYAVTTLEDALVFNRDYLVEKKVDYRKEIVFGGKVAQETPDAAQQRIIRTIRNDARFKTVEVANKLGLSARTVVKKVRELEKQGIIQGYTTFLRLESIGMHLFKLIVSLQDCNEKKRNALIGFARQNPHVVHIIKTLGNWELEIELEAEDVNHAYDLIKGIKNSFPDIIKLVDLVIVTNEHKLDFFPERDLFEENAH